MKKCDKCNREANVVFYFADKEIANCGHCDYKLDRDPLEIHRKMHGMIWVLKKPVEKREKNPDPKAFDYVGYAITKLIKDE